MFSSLQFDPLFHETGIPLAVMGMTVVFLTLIILVVIISAMPKLMAVLDGISAEKTVSAKSQNTAVKPTPASRDGGDLPPELIAVLAAAASEMESGPVRIVRIRPLTPSELAWTLEGRLRHHASHQLQPRNR
jgi:sodium pump decarboxylase gamma subunit